MSITLDGTSGIQSDGSLTLGDAVMAVPTGDAPLFGCRAWVNFDGTKDTTGAASTANTNRLIRASGNVSSALRTGTGIVRVSFTTPMPDANYSVVATSNSAQIRLGTTAQITADYIEIVTENDSGTNEDNALVCVTIVR